MSNPWAWGWDTIAALGTLALAVATVALAWKTKRLADASGAEIAAGVRPVLVPASGTVQDRPVTVTEVSIDVRIRNVGSGPALDVEAGVDGTSPAEWDNAVVAVADEPRITFKPAESWLMGGG